MPSFWNMKTSCCILTEWSSHWVLQERGNLFLPAEHNACLLYLPSEFVEAAESNLRDLRSIDAAVKPTDPDHWWLLLARLQPFLNLLNPFKKTKLKGLIFPLLGSAYCMLLTITSLSETLLGAIRQSIVNPASPILPLGPGGWRDPLISPQSSYVFCSLRQSIPRIFPKCVQAMVCNPPLALEPAQLSPACAVSDLLLWGTGFLAFPLPVPGSWQVCWRLGGQIWWWHALPLIPAFYLYTFHPAEDEFNLL